MNDILHANIFFFITSIAVVVVTIPLFIVLWYLIGVMREVRQIVRKVHRASNELEKDLEHLRREFRAGSSKLASVLNAFVGYALGRLAKSPRPRRRPLSEDETDSDESV